MLVVAEKLAVLLFRENVGHGIYARVIKKIDVDQVVSNLVCGVREHKNDGLKSLCNALKADRETVSRKDGENDSRLSSGELCADIRRDLINVREVTLCTCNN